MRGMHRPRYAATLALVVALVGPTSGCGTAVCKDTWFGPNQARYFAAGFLGGAVASSLAGHQGSSIGGSAGVGIGVVAAGGAVKETIGLAGPKGCWSWKDLTWILLGGAIGTTLGAATSH